jgi:hypothetical protein
MIDATLFLLSFFGGAVSAWTLAYYVMPSPAGGLVPDDVSPPVSLNPPGDQRCDYLGAVRQNQHMLDELVSAIRRAWPLRYPMPPEIDSLLNYHQHARDTLRDGRLKKLAEVCRESD